MNNDVNVFDKNKFVIVSDEIPNCFLEIRYYSSFNFVGTRVDGYVDPVAILTKVACNALRRANEEFNKMGYIIKIYDCYRPQMAVDHFVRWSEDFDDVKTKEYFYPNLTKKQCF